VVVHASTVLERPASLKPRNSISRDAIFIIVLA
jgi:hypothetical protein